jgi:hypothetical protein
MADERYTWTKTWDKCPNCGSERRVTDTVREELIQDGKWRPEVASVAINQPVPMIDPGKQVLSFPLIMANIDICEECGTLWAYRATCAVQVTTGQQQKGRPGFPPGRN